MKKQHFALLKYRPKLQGKMRRLLLAVSILCLETSQCFSVKDLIVSRRDLVLQLPLGVVATYGYGRLVYNALQVQGIRYPPAHEERVASIISAALLAAATDAGGGNGGGSGTSTTPSLLSDNGQTFRILEVGVGQDCRVIRRGLYDHGLKELVQQQPQISRVEVTGIDLQLPKPRVLQQAQSQLLSALIPTTETTTTASRSINVQAQKGDITMKLPYPDGYFDAAVCCLTLCSVSDPATALTEIHRVIRPNGGTFGYVEHVAVNPSEEDRKFLELQQRLLDPLQQAVADNCHLHRYTEDTIADIFGVGDENMAKQLHRERFFVDSMWPVTCQCCGVVQR